MHVKIKHNLPDIKKYLNKFPDVSRRAIKVKMEDAIRRLISEIMDYTPEGASSVHLKTQYFEKIAQIGRKTQGQISTPVKYFEPVEFGSRPHYIGKEGIRSLMQWCERKLGASSTKEQKSAAFAIARIIADVGTEGQHMVEYAWKDNEHIVYGILDQIPDEIIGKLSN